MNQLTYPTGWGAIPPMPQTIDYTNFAQLYGSKRRSLDHAVLDRRTDVAVKAITYYANLLRAADGKAELEFPYHLLDSMLRIILRHGELLENEGRLLEAENFYVWSLARFGDHDPRRFYILYWIGVVHSNQVRLQGDPDAKERHISIAKYVFDMALCGFTNLWGHNNMWERTVVLALGKLYENQNMPQDTAALLNEGAPKLSKDFKRQYLDWIDVYLRLMEHNQLEMAQSICDTIFIFLARTLGHSHELTNFVALDSAFLTCQTNQFGNAKEINQGSKTFNQLMFDKAPTLIEAYQQLTGHSTQVVQKLCGTICAAFVGTFGRNHELTRTVAQDSLYLFLQLEQTGTTQEFIWN